MSPHLILGDVDRGAVVEESGDLSDGIIVERRLEVLGNVDDDRRRQTRDDVAAMKGRTYYMCEWDESDMRGNRPHSSQGS